jgi:hypothetical protein
MMSSREGCVAFVNDWYMYGMRILGQYWYSRVLQRPHTLKVVPASYNISNCVLKHKEGGFVGWELD